MTVPGQQPASTAGGGSADGARLCTAASRAKKRVAHRRWTAREVNRPTLGACAAHFTPRRSATRGPRRRSNAVRREVDDPAPTGPDEGRAARSQRDGAAARRRRVDQAVAGAPPRRAGGRPSPASSAVAEPGGHKPARSPPRHVVRCCILRQVVGGAAQRPPSTGRRDRGLRGRPRLRPSRSDPFRLFIRARRERRMTAPWRSRRRKVGQQRKYRLLAGWVTLKQGSFAQFPHQPRHHRHRP